jgi:hypothetical protein
VERLQANRINQAREVDGNHSSELWPYINRSMVLRAGAVLSLQ